ncbi:pyridoxal-dependent decarboxylase, exosortase A system-associated [Noviherbaspirillum sedimenti]|uniref:Pyridoxal-dependent decarboxylase, exosortase A system-associated n=1 Tax=Noviherbaspirillum sedimenti TaxID=2320865 RepID=A0A3A3G524_9BURK|nr:pyridoxal-dependent decarboxylase, exosortase A system-associated [Noviherbaspirillum sedimenti]RJG01879.1 pyridoxal-dependent decarboxylase, exosortase A system-associated [Noviherbaspirillum sedimenti]
MNSDKPRHAPQSQFPVRDGHLHIGGIALPRLAQRVGRTPFYAYDRALLTARARELRAALPAGLRLHYSLKANPMPALVQHMSSLVDGLDVASGGELKVALDTGMQAQHISFAGPGKTDAELTQAIAAGAVLHLESLRELESVARIGEALGLRPMVMLRINPDFELKSSGMKMGGGPRQFGVDVEQAPQLLRRISELGLDWQGLHIFSGSQCLNAQAIAETQSKTFELALRLADHAAQAPRLLNIGGGFGIPYFAGETALQVGPIADNLAHWLPRAQAALGGATVALELGRYLVGEAGIYVTQVIDRKVSRGQVFLVTDGGMHHHLAASGNLGQVIRKNYPVAVGNRMNEKSGETVSVVGPLCTPLDMLAERMELPAADVGDLIVIFQSGAYGCSASPSAFLGHPQALEVLV